MTQHPPPADTGRHSIPTQPSTTARSGTADRAKRVGVVPGSVEDAGIDVVPGQPPVPITVWRTAEADHDQPSVIPPRLARRLVAAYSLPGEIVLDLTDGHTLAAAAGHAGRHHRPGWFTDASALIIGPVTPAGPAAAAPGRDAESHQADADASAVHDAAAAAHATPASGRPPT